MTVAGDAEVGRPERKSYPILSFNSGTRAALRREYQF